MRLIDADRLLEQIKKETEELANSDPFLAGLCVAEEYIDEAPTVEQIRWIPCSERLPEKGLRVLMQLNNAWQIVGWYDKEDKQWYVLPFSQEVVNDCVLAWMPLPEAYEVE